MPPVAAIESQLRSATRARRLPFTRREAGRLGAMYGVIALLHVAGWGLFLYYGHRAGPVYAGAGGLAYSFGLRHAFDADHISAVDDTTRFLMSRGKRPLGVGFFFSLGHSTVVIVLALVVAAAAGAVQRNIPAFQEIGGTVGALVSGTFLLVIAVLDLIVLLGLLDIWRKAKTGQYDAEQLDELMQQRGFMNRVLGRRWRNVLSESWHIYPIGVLFGLGFDTATEVALLGLTTTAATDGGGALPIGALLALPLLFAAGMTLMDTTDGVFMAKAYGWAFSNPVRKIYYNLSTVALGVVVAGAIGVVQYLHVIANHGNMHGGFWEWLDALDFELLGYAIVATFVLFWAASVLWYRLRRIEQRYGVRASTVVDAGLP